MNARIFTSLPRRAFTLIEMLTVIGILAILIAIILPAVGHARTAAKRADTSSMLAQFGNAIHAFETDQRHAPGYFGPRALGDPTNGMSYGFTTCEDMMLDLIGGITTQPVAAGSVIQVGPTATNIVNVDLGAFGGSAQSKAGVSSHGYFQMDSKRFVAQNGPGQRLPTTADIIQLPVLVDSFGSPVLAWAAEDVPSVGSNSIAALDTSGSPTQGPITTRYYRAQNAGFLDAKSLGKLAVDQSFPSPTQSVITKGAMNVISSMEALLGNPAAPDPSATGTPRPLSARAPIVLHSAGADGVYMGQEDRGARSGSISYVPNQDPFAGSQFDDILSLAGQ